MDQCHMHALLFKNELNMQVLALHQSKCDPILENHTTGHMQNLWEFSIENFSDF